MIDVPLKPGLTAFSGRNGAGKSVLLEGLSKALAFQPWPRGRWEVLIRLSEGDSASSEIERWIASLLERKRNFAPAPDAAVILANLKTLS